MQTEKRFAVKTKHIFTVLLATTVALTALPTAVPSVEAQTLIDLLFNNQNRPRRGRVIEVRPEVQRPSPKRIQRVSAPRYRDYTVAAVGSASVASLLPSGDGANALEPSLDSEAKRFSEALRLAPETRIAVERDIADAIKAHYAANPGFVWSRGNSVTDAAKAVAEVLSRAGAHGMKGAEYAVDVPPDGWSITDPASRTRELLEFEVSLSARAARYARDMKDGVIEPNRLSGYHDFPKDRLTGADALAALTSAEDPAAWLKSNEPRQPAYAALQRELGVLRSETVEETVIPEGTFVKPGQTEEALPLIMKALDKRLSKDLRDKHAATFAEYLGDDAYDDAIVALVKDFQGENGLSKDGIIGRNTLGKLTDVSQAQKIRRVEMALERLRWHPEEFGRRHVLINQPAYRATYSENGEDTLSMRAIVGKPSNQTSFFYDEIEKVVYNPYWGVPQSIIVNEMLPKLYRDPSYLDRNGYVVTNASGRQVASSNVNWYQYAGKVPYSVRQKPGPRNALGELKILFPNKHAIYMHDTPSRNLFSRDTRALSHGCVRLQQPREMAAAVLGTNVSHIEANLGGPEQVEMVKEKIPVFVSYYTAWPTAAGKVEYFVDIYGRDKHLGEAFDALHTARDSADS
jgi:murein L,D-transpeptidase YcbB/YkuD